MDIICAKCGKHFSSIETAREHNGHCRETSKGEPIHWIPARNSKITPEEWEKLINSINAQGISQTVTPSNLEPTAVESSGSEDHPETIIPMPLTASENIQRINDKTQEGKKKRGKISGYRIQPWLTALLFIFASSLIGVGISLLMGTFIPFWLLFGFSLVYAVEKWLYYQTRRHKYIGELYRLFLNLTILCLLGLTIWSGIKLFSQQYFNNPLVGSLVFLVELVFFIWMWRTISKNSWRWPSMKLTLFVALVISIILAFAGVNPFSNYKDTVISGISNVFSYLNNELFPASDNIYESNTMINTNSETDEADETPLTGVSHGGEYMNYYLGLVKIPDGVIHGSECYGEYIILINNKEAENPTYSELLNFLRTDDTDEYPYQYELPLLGFYYGNAEDNVDLTRIEEIIDGNLQPDAPHVCADFAERLHNNAEMAGIRCGYVSLDLTGYTDINNLGIPPDSGHACNVFETTNRGLIYIDCTGISDNYGPPNNDRIVNIQIGQQYNPDYLFPSGGWYIPGGQMGVVTDMFITWDGDWR